MSIQEARRAAFQHANPPVSGCRLNNQVQPYGEFYQSWPELTGDPEPDAAMARYNEDWELWNAALDSVCVQLSDYIEYDRDLCIASIEAAGIRCEVAK